MFRRLRGHHALVGLPLALIVPVAGCETQEPPKVIDTTTEAKAPAPPVPHTVEPTKPAQ